MDWKKQLKRGDKEKEKENIELKEDLEVMREDVKEFKKTGILDIGEITAVIGQIKVIP